MEKIQMSEFRKWLGRAYVFTGIQLLTVILLLGMIELAVRWWGNPIEPLAINAQTLITDKSQEPTFREHPFAAFTWIPNARFMKQHVNSQGFVSTREIPFEKKPGEIRIITLGESSTVGNGNVDEETYPRRLESMLQQHFPNRTISVINAAAGGYSTVESLGYLQSRLIHYRPDIVLIMHGWNDMYYFGLTDQELSEWRKNFNVQALTDNSAAIKYDAILPADVRYLSWSQTYLHFRELMRRWSAGRAEMQTTIERRFSNAKQNANGSLEIKVKPVNENALALYTLNLRQINNLCLQRNIQCYNILQPSLFTAEADRKDQKILQAMLKGALYHSFDFDTHVELFNRLHQIDREVFDEAHVIDATDMSGKAGLFFDHIHQNPAGTEALARHVYDRLLPVIEHQY